MGNFNKSLMFKKTAEMSKSSNFGNNSKIDFIKSNKNFYNSKSSYMNHVVEKEDNNEISINSNTVLPEITKHQKS